MKPKFPSNETAIVGIGATEFSKNSGRSELQLACECIKAAVEDAGLEPSDVDGLVTFTLDNSAEIDLSRSLGIGDLSYFARTPYGGGGACATVAHAVAAIHAGLAEVVVCYRAFNERSGVRFGQPVAVRPSSDSINMNWATVYGLNTAASFAAMFARRYMHDYGATSLDFGAVAVTSRKHAATNPAAWFYQRPITLEDHQKSRWIVEPLHLLDCCQESDGGVAIVVTHKERARSMRNAPAWISAAAIGSCSEQELMTTYNRPDIAVSGEMQVVGRQLWSQSGLRPRDMDVAQLYDHFTPLVLQQLEALEFCDIGQARHFIADGALELDGALPLNTHGGQLGEAYIHGMNGIAEAVRQLRGTAVNQLADCRHALVTAGTAVPTSALILTKD
ncbi:MAG TPA: lipid-transfer protein [Ramlibacter sp.]|nr:lipid-transfer protein [Ramlibacter sp.]